MKERRESLLRGGDYERGRNISRANGRYRSRITRVKYRRDNMAPCSVIRSYRTRDTMI